MNIRHLYAQHVVKRGRTLYFWVGVLIALGLAIDFGYFRWYLRRYNERAQVALAHCLEIYGRAVREKQPHLWEQASREVSSRGEKYASSSLAPYFLALNADIAQVQGNPAKARELMSSALSKLSKKSPTYGFYAVKNALMQIDASDAATQTAGKQALKAMAEDKKNPQRDMALYYQGLLAFDSGDYNTAFQSWDVLMQQYGASSIWSHMAKEKMSYAA